MSPCCGGPVTTRFRQSSPIEIHMACLATNQCGKMTTPCNPMLVSYGCGMYWWVWIASSFYGECHSAPEVDFGVDQRNPTGRLRSWSTEPQRTTGRPPDLRSSYHLEFLQSMDAKWNDRVASFQVRLYKTPTHGTGFQLATRCFPPASHRFERQIRSHATPA